MLDCLNDRLGKAFEDQLSTSYEGYVELGYFVILVSYQVRFLLDTCVRTKYDSRLSG